MKIQAFLAVTIVLIAVDNTFAQAIPAQQQASTALIAADRFPQPVRRLSGHALAGRDGSMPIRQTAEPVETVYEVHTAPDHRVIVSPQASKHRSHRKHAKPSNPMKKLSHHRTVQPPPAVIPNARRRETWKTPYSYGYFGASRSRQWTLHYGYRDRVTEWRLH